MTSSEERGSKEAIRGNVRNIVSFVSILGEENEAGLPSRRRILLFFLFFPRGFLVMFPRPHDHPPGIPWLFPAAATSCFPSEIAF